jgi:putative redox protein
MYLPCNLINERKAMPEKVVVHQNKSFQTEFKAANPEEEISAPLKSVMHLHALTPYGMLLASLGACTAIVLNTYAQNHDIPLDAVTVEAEYDRVFSEDCENCDEETEYEEIIREGLKFEGDLDEKDLKRLHQVARFCSIRQMLEKGIQVKTV